MHYSDNTASVPDSAKPRGQARNPLLIYLFFFYFSGVFRRLSNYRVGDRAQQHRVAAGGLYECPVADTGGAMATLYSPDYSGGRVIAVSCLTGDSGLHAGVWTGILAKCDFYVV